MKAYIVRLKEGEEHARELVGFFVAHSLEQLYWLIDECAPPTDCEYKELVAGGIFWSKCTGKPVPLPPDFDFEAQPDDWSYLPNEAELTGGWEEPFHDQDDDEDENVAPWLPVSWEPAEDEGDDAVIERPTRRPGAWKRRRARR